VVVLPPKTLALFGRFASAFLSSTMADGSRTSNGRDATAGGN